MRPIFAIVLLAPLVLCGPAHAQSGHPFEPVGVWRFFDTDGTPFTARLWADQRAATDWAGGEHGIWRWEGDRVRILYTDGWDDLLHQRDGGFRKSGYAPGADRCAPPSNDTAAERLSGDPDAKP
jgi:hypothetical protein